jgi:cation diffusion facilitator CzcD-associated flavoprotein CzcO
MKYVLTVLLASLVSSFTPDLWACGDSLYRVGKSVSHRVYTAPLPGNVLVYGQSESAQQLAEALAESGHTVELVDSEVALSLEMSSGNYDVIIATFRDHEAIDSAVQRAPGTTYLPVAMDKQEAKVAEQSYDRVLVADRHEIKHYLKAIHKTLKSKA